MRGNLDVYVAPAEAGSRAGLPGIRAAIWFRGWTADGKVCSVLIVARHLGAGRRATLLDCARRRRR